MPPIMRSDEPRSDRRGQLRPQVVFRHVAADPAGTAPALVSRDTAVQRALDERALIEAVGQAKAAGRQKPRAIARWILAQPFTDASRWVDVEGLLTGSVEQLERGQQSRRGSRRRLEPVGCVRGNDRKFCSSACRQWAY
jgi:hypothetical protein